MANNRRRRNKNDRLTETFLGILLPLVLAGLSVADFLDDGQIDRNLIGAMLILALGSLGWRIDVILERYFQARAGFLDASKHDEEEDDEEAEDEAPTRKVKDKGKSDGSQRPSEGKEQD